ncbi:TonB-dependent receptor [Altericroceibacterium xinjiangense]|uniref:TonB-dependent receptor n=1 Tax=Altericroceibacterium xinjiangense TaxID=762261 RepID=UPI0019D13D88|nr:TonB-dependent receptor [Altericroceibacterium xinjiangense]
MRAWMVTSAAGIAVATGSAAAQAQGVPETSPTSTTSVASGGALSEIVVTALRREEDLQDVPIAATALSGEALQNKGVERIEGLQFVAPSLSVTDAGLTQSVNIRGIGIASGSPAVANGVAVYIDGVFQPPVLTTSSFYDIRSVEVLRGPQGTLVGSNATGGAVFINTESPSTDRVKGYAQASYGSYNEVTAQGAINFPLTNTLAVRAAGNFRDRDSYYEDLGPFDNEPGSLEEYAGRFGVLWEPGAFTALGKVEWIDRNTGGYAYRPIQGTAFDNNRTDDIRELTYNAPTRNYERGFLSSLELRYELDDGMVLRSQSGYTFKRINNLYDSDAAITPPAPGISANQTQDQYAGERQYSQEFNVISPAENAFDWILGAYFQRNMINVDIENRNGGPFAPDPTDIIISQKKTTWGVFAHTTYEIDPAFEVQLGLRYSGFEAEGGGSVSIGRGIPVFPPNGLVVADLAGTHDDGLVTGKLALNWTPDADSLVYAFVARGYKPGGANSATSEFGPESVWNYELGWKSAFLDNRVRTQIAAFYMDYSDFQFDATDLATGQTGVTNIANATIKGIEAQLQAQFGGFGFDAGVAYVDSSLDSVEIVNRRLLPPLNQFGPQCPAGAPSNPPTCFDYGPFLQEAGGGPNLFSPEWSYNLGVYYEFLLAGGASLTPRLNWGYVGPRWTNLFYDPALDYLEGRGLLSAQLALQTGNWTVEAYGTNLTDEEFVSGQSGNNEFYGAPREYGLRATVRF